MSSSSSPFDIIVITSPDEKASVAVRELIISSCGVFSSPPPDDSAAASPSSSSSQTQPLHSADGTIFISSCDPCGTRLGSGGGTIAALAEAHEAYYGSSNNNDEEEEPPLPLPTVLICHAGGESSRCPTQITLGKAWTSLPSKKEDEEIVLNPTSLLISTLSHVFSDIPRGSVVVAASDVLLSFYNSCSNANNGVVKMKTIHFENNSSGVFGLAVPAPLSTAKNHGVFVVAAAESSNTNNNNDIDDGWKLQSTFKVLQKPSINEMMSFKNPQCVFQTTTTTTTNNNNNTNNEKDEEKMVMAWIDTGVITFLPYAVQTLRELSRTVLKNCTRVGLKELYCEKYGGSSSSSSSSSSIDDDDNKQRLEEFARGIAPKICLYGDMLHALQTTSSSSSSSSCNNGSSSLFGALSKHELQTCIIPEGSFVHLGTTSELIDFLVAGGGATTAYDNGDGSSSSSGGGGGSGDEQRRTKLQSFAKSIGISSRSNAFVSGFNTPEDEDDDSLVIINSILIADNSRWNKSSSSIGEGTVIEHCIIPYYTGGSSSSSGADNNGTIEVGKGCLLSGIRGDLKGRHIRIPSEMCLQILPLREGGGGGGDFVCLCFGVHDGIKEATTLYGMDLNQVLQRSGLTVSDLWDESIPSSRRTLWNAKINPIMMCADEEMNCPELDFSFLEWIQSLRDDDAQLNASALEGLRQWKESKRIAICDIQKCVDSEAEAKYRSTISSVEVHQLNWVTDCLLGQKHEPCNFDHLGGVGKLLDPSLMKRALKALDNVSYQAIEEGRLHVLGRTFMVQSELLSSLYGYDDEPESTVIELPLNLTAESIAHVMATRDTMLSEEKYSPCCQLLEGMASMATQRCICAEQCHSFVYTDPLPLDTTATASAPARIDLAGGWSDTPPISFEHGGAVACLAVLVDGKRPLRAQCRMVKGMRGIRLCTESRSLTDDETLLRSSETTIQTLADLESFSNPESECALLKCALVWLGLCPVDYIQDNGRKMQSIQPFLQKFCQRGGEDDGVGLEIISSSLLPTGSGMGSSSILAGCIIACIAKCIGVVLDGIEGNDQHSTSGSTETNGTNSLVHGVLMVEQLLTSGGGWQDQIGGLVGGLKLATSDMNILPLQTKTKQQKLSTETVNRLNERLILVDTGQPRLAKNILRNVLRRWARRSSDIVATVRELVSEASNAIDYATNGDLNGLGMCMSKYWDLKKTMAGESSGVEPENVNRVLQLLTSSKKIAGGTLCGAGGGGFLALITLEGTSRAEIESAVSEAGTDTENFKWHYCTVAADGLLIDVE
jgi:galactokinase/mevalonate kinase-like predicted kinase